MSEEKRDRHCGYNRFKRPRYFHGMLLDEKDFLAEQGYHRDKRRLLARMLYGWGVVCGLGLKWKKGKNWIKVTPGLALDCCGNDIWVDEPYTLKDVAALLPKRPARSRELCEEPDDRKQSRDYYLCIHYRETATDPIPVYVTGGDCEEKTCDFSKYKEGFCLRLQEECPQPDCPDGLLKQFCECCGDMGKSEEPCEPCEPCWEDDCEGLEKEALCQCEALNRFCCKPLPCPQCPDTCCDQHCVVLGKIRIDSEGCLEGICINDCRTYVLSGRMIQYLIESVFCGVEEWWKVYRPNGKEECLPDIAHLTRNPIDALCWFARRLVVEDGELQQTKTGEECLKRIFGEEERPNFVSKGDFTARLKQMDYQWQQQLKAVDKDWDKQFKAVVEDTVRTAQFTRKTRQYDAAIEKYEAEIKKRDEQIADYKSDLSTVKGRLTRLEKKLRGNQGESGKK